MIYTIQLSPGELIYEGGTDNVLKTVEYGASYDWGEAAHTAIPATWDVDTIKADQVFSGWSFRGSDDLDYLNAPTGTYNRFSNPAKDEVTFLAETENPDRYDYFTATRFNYFSAPEFVVNSMFHCSSLSVEDKYLKLEYDGSNTDPIVSFTFEKVAADNNGNIVTPRTHPYFSLTYRFETTEGFLASDNPKITARYAAATGWAENNIIENVSVDPPKNTHINSLVFKAPNDSTLTTFYIRLDWIDGSVETSMLGETMRVYALAFAQNEPQANSIAQALQEKFRSYKENSLLD